jgi:hypothetical protein
LFGLGGIVQIPTGYGPMVGWLNDGSGYGSLDIDCFGNILTAPAPAIASQVTPTTPALGATVAVPAGATTAVWTTNTATRSLTITIPLPPCVLATADNSASWYLSGSGYDFNQQGDPVPNKSLTLNCTAAQTAYVSETH